MLFLLVLVNINLKIKIKKQNLNFSSFLASTGCYIQQYNKSTNQNIETKKQDDERFGRNQKLKISE